MPGPSNSVANAAPMPTAYFADATRIQMQAIGNVGTFGSHGVDYIKPPSPVRATIQPRAWQFQWPHEYWRPQIDQFQEWFRTAWRRISEGA